MQITLNQENDSDLMLDLSAICDDVGIALRKAEKAIKDHDKHSAIEQLRRILFLTEDFQ